MTKIRALLIDPSLFTPPYDGGLTQGLIDAGVEPRWAARPLRPGEKPSIPPALVDDLFYRRSDRTDFAWKKGRALAKGLSHIVGLFRLTEVIFRFDPHVVHFQWLVLPILDGVFIGLLRLRRPVILTMHDTIPYNGDKLSLMQRIGLGLPLRWADRIIVHTQGAKKNLMARGCAPEKIAVIQHGPLHLDAEYQQHMASHERKDPRWTFVLFGELKPYKGADILIEAIGSLPVAMRESMRFIIAGRPRMDMAPLLSRIEELGLGDCIELNLARLDETEMATLFAEADTFMFPYRQIDASGVFFLVKSLGKWMIATKVGVFAESITDRTGALIPPEDVGALTAALTDAFERRPAVPPKDGDQGWTGIGLTTRTVYQSAMDDRR